MKTLMWVLGALYAQLVFKLIFYKSHFLQEWYNVKPLRLDKKQPLFQYFDAMEIESYHTNAIEICETLGIRIPKTYLLGDMGYFKSNARKGYIVYKKNPVIFVYYKSNNEAAFTIAHELYHAYQRAYCPERFKGNCILAEWVEQSEIEAQAFAIAYIETNYPKRKINLCEWEHRAISEEVKRHRNNNGEMIVLRAMAEAFKEKYFSDDVLG